MTVSELIAALAEMPPDATVSYPECEAVACGHPLAAGFAGLSLIANQGHQMVVLGEGFTSMGEWGFLESGK